MNAESCKNKIKVVFVEVSKEDVVGVVFGAGGSIDVFPEHLHSRIREHPLTVHSARNVATRYIGATYLPVKCTFVRDSMTRKKHDHKVEADSLKGTERLLSCLFRYRLIPPCG